MSDSMNRYNVTILTGDNELTHWIGTPGTSGGELDGIDNSPTVGPPDWEYPGATARSAYRFTVTTKILGADATAQKAFIAKYGIGTVFTSPTISGLPDGLDWVVRSAQTQHHATGNEPSTLTIELAELHATTT